MTRRLKNLLLLLPFLLLAGKESEGAVIKLLHQSSLYADGQGGALSAPEGMACGSGPFLVIADSGKGRLLKVTLQNGIPGEIKEIRSPQLPFPIKVQVNPQGEIFALDGRLRSILRLGSAGEPRGALEVKDIPDGRPMVIRSFRIDGKGTFYLLDIASGRVVVLAPDGRFVRSIAVPKPYGAVSDLAVSFRGDIFLVDSVGKRIYASRDSGEFSALKEDLGNYLDFPVGIATDERGTLYVVDQNGAGIVVLDPEGNFQGKLLSMGWKEGFLRYPTQVCFDGQGKAFIVDRGNDRLQIFNVVGK